VLTREQFAALGDELVHGIDRCDRLLAALPLAAEVGLGHWFVPEAVADEVRWLVKVAVDSGRRVADLVKELLTGLAAPAELIRLSWHWRDVRGGVTAVASALSPQNQSVDGAGWRGPARDAYDTTVSGQAAAATQLGVVADGTASALTECVVAGSAFYVTLGVIVARLVTAAVAALAAFGTAVFSWAGAALIIEEAGVDAATISTALAALSLCVGAQARNMVTLHGLAVDQTSFPGAAWPRANTAGYADATVTDGDADWSLRR
jgi:hypothetical protein